MKRLKSTLKITPFLLISPLSIAATQTVNFMGEGPVQSYFTRLGLTSSFSYDDQSSLPISLSVNIPGSAISQLRNVGDANYEESDDRICHLSDCAAGHRYFIEMENSQFAVNNIPFTFLQLNFNPEGYSRPGRANNQNVQEDNEILGRALLGIHLYHGISLSDIQQIQPGSAAYTYERANGSIVSVDASQLDADSITRVRSLPAEERQPNGFRNLPQSSAQVPWMGTHWIDSVAFPAGGGNMQAGRNTAPPDQMAIFHGSYNGHFVFIEPIIYENTFKALQQACSPATTEAPTTAPTEPMATTDADATTMMGPTDADPTTAPNTSTEPPAVACRMRQCYEIRLPDQMSTGGYYPELYCLNYEPISDAFRVSFEAFRLVPGYVTNTSPVANNLSAATTQSSASTTATTAVTLVATTLLSLILGTVL